MSLQKQGQSTLRQDLTFSFSPFERWHFCQQQMFAVSHLDFCWSTSPPLWGRTQNPLVLPCFSWSLLGLDCKHPISWGISLMEKSLQSGGLIKKKAILSILQFGEILKKESAAVNTVVTTIVVTTHISVLVICFNLGQNSGLGP